MAAKEFPEYKYGAGTGGRKIFINLTSLLLAFIILYAVFIMTPFMAVLLILPVIMLIYNYRSGSANTILIGSRYLIIGTNVIYYKNIEKTALDKNAGKLNLYTGDGKSFEINSASFPTNARKPDKIQKNKTDKFIKTSDKIFARLKEVSPGAIE